MAEMTDLKRLAALTTVFVLLTVTSPVVALAAHPRAAVSSAPASQPSATAPAPQVDPRVEEILDRLHDAGRRVNDLTAALTFRSYNPILDETIVKTGRLAFRRMEPHSRFLVHFDRLVQNGRITDSDEWHLFDGRWYVEAREQTRTMIRREVVRPGEQMDPFRLGQGPFPLPIGQPKADILRHFTVQYVPPAPTDPPETDHLRCIPREDSPLYDDYRQLDFFIDRRTDLPVRVVADQRRDDNRVTVDLADLQLNQGLPPSHFEIPDTVRWIVETEPLPPQP